MADTMRTQAELLTIFADGQNAGDITEQDLRDLIISIPEIQGHLWEFNLDGEYTLAAKRAIAAGVRTKLTIDGVLDYQTSNVAKVVWNKTTQKFEPLIAGDFYQMRLALTGWSDVASVNQFDIEFDVGGTAGVIGKETGVFAKGAAGIQNFNFSTGFFAGGDFVTNGGEIYITPVSDASFWEAAVTISRVYTPTV